MTSTEQTATATMLPRIHMGFTAVGEIRQERSLGRGRRKQFATPTTGRLTANDLQPIVDRAPKSDAGGDLSMRTIAKDMTVAVATITSVGILVAVLAYSLLDQKAVGRVFDSQELHVAASQ